MMSACSDDPAASSGTAEAAMADFADYPSCSSRSNRIALVECNLQIEQL